MLYSDVLDGRKVLVKERVRKGYRLAQIDERLRRERTNREVKLLTDARAAGVLTPQVLESDSASGKIVMEFVDGERVKEYLGRVGSAAAGKVCRLIGESVGRLHAAGMVHGDLTTSNMISRPDGKIVFIDFGLGSHTARVEDKAVDMKLLHDSLKAAHFKLLAACWKNIVEGYVKEYKNAGEVIKQIETIEGRMRYAERAAVA